MNLILSFIIASIIFFREKTSIYGIFYLAFLPLIIFSNQSVLQLLVSMLIGYLLFLLLKKPRGKVFLLLVSILILTLVIERPRLGLDMGMMNAINSQRGEHPGFQNSLFSKIIHNKTELSHSFIKNLTLLLSPAAIFASGFWHNINKYYPLGYLFPWDIYLIYRYISDRKNNNLCGRQVYFWIILFLSVLFSGIFYLDQALLYSFSIIYFLALLSINGFSTLSSKTKILFIVLNLVYLLYQINITSYFKI